MYFGEKWSGDGEPEVSSGDGFQGTELARDRVKDEWIYGRRNIIEIHKKKGLVYQ